MVIDDPRILRHLAWGCLVWMLQRLRSRARGQGCHGAPWGAMRLRLQVSLPDIIWLVVWIFLFFPTCQVRVVRFYQSACPPPPPPPPPPPRLAVLLALLLASASSTSTSALPTLPTRRQALRQLPSCPAQCAPLDLNLRAAQLSVHRWTSTAR